MGDAGIQKMQRHRDADEVGDSSDAKISKTPRHRRRGAPETRGRWRGAKKRHGDGSRKQHGEGATEQNVDCATEKYRKCVIEQHRGLRELTREGATYIFEFLGATSATNSTDAPCGKRRTQTNTRTGREGFYQILCWGCDKSCHRQCHILCNIESSVCHNVVHFKLTLELKV